MLPCYRGFWASVVAVAVAVKASVKVEVVREYAAEATKVEEASVGVASIFAVLVAVAASVAVAVSAAVVKVEIFKVSLVVFPKKFSSAKDISVDTRLLVAFVSFDISVDPTVSASVTMELSVFGRIVDVCCLFVSLTHLLLAAFALSTLKQNSSAGSSVAPLPGVSSIFL